jgi:putative phage-type endonuclease
MTCNPFGITAQSAAASYISQCGHSSVAQYAQYAAPRQGEGLSMSDFHSDRRTGIGGSDAPAALGLSHWMSPYGLWLEKTGALASRDEPEWMSWGKLIEPVIRAEYERRTGRTVQLLPMLRHPTHPFMIAHLDGLADQSRVLEIKMSRTSNGWGEPGSDEIPLEYLVQVHHCLVVAGAPVADVAALIGGSELRLYEIHGDDAITRELVRQEHEFWQRVKNNDPPDPRNLGDAQRRWGKLAAAGTVVAGEAERLAVALLHEIRERTKRLEAEEEAAKLVLMAALGERGDALVDEAGVPLATWKLDKGRKGYTVEPREPSRKFLLK